MFVLRGSDDETGQIICEQVQDPNRSPGKSPILSYLTDFDYVSCKSFNLMSKPAQDSAKHLSESTGALKESSQLSFVWVIAVQ